MDFIAPPKATETLPAHAPAQPPESGPAAQAAEQHIAEHAAMLRNGLAPNRVAVSLDVQAQRFVSIVTDATTSETLRKYPSEAQLAYSRAVMSYLRALARSS